MNPLPLLRPEWPAPPQVQAACSTRAGGASTGAWAGLNLGARCGDDPQAVTQNRQLLRRALALPAEPCWLQQVHGTRAVALPCADADADAGADADAEPQADAAFTAQAGVVCAVLAADCLPVLFCDRAGSVVAAAHAGWRGLAAGVLEATVAAMGLPPAQLLAWLGPAIGPEAFEVGGEVRQAFVAQDAGAAQAFVPGRAGHFFADLFMLARRRLAAAGVEQVYGGGLSTHADPARWYSFRRDRVTGRQAALIWLQP